MKAQAKCESPSQVRRRQPSSKVLAKCEGSFQMRRRQPSAKAQAKCEGSFQMRRRQPSAKAPAKCEAKAEVLSKRALPIFQHPHLNSAYACGWLMTSKYRDREGGLSSDQRAREQSPKPRRKDAAEEMEVSRRLPDRQRGRIARSESNKFSQQWRSKDEPMAAMAQ